MEDFTVPLLSSSGYNDNPSGIAQHRHHQQQQQQQQQQIQQQHHMHQQQHHIQHQHQHQATHPSQHHKDHMLATGNAPIVARTLSGNYLYDTTTTTTTSAAATTSANDTLKGEYAAFTNCIQQSALLDQRGGNVDTSSAAGRDGDSSGGSDGVGGNVITNSLVDSNLDGVSLSGLCDLKFSSPSPLSSALNQDSTFKNLTPLLTQLDARMLQQQQQQQQQQQHNLTAVPSFSNLLFVPANGAGRQPDASHAATSTTNEYMHELAPKTSDMATADTATTTTATSPNVDTLQPQPQPHYMMLKPMSMAEEPKYLQHQHQAQQHQPLHQHHHQQQQQQQQHTHQPSQAAYTNGYAAASTPSIIAPLPSVITTAAATTHQHDTQQQQTHATSSSTATRAALMDFQNSFMQAPNSTTTTATTLTTLNSYSNGNNLTTTATTAVATTTTSTAARKTKATTTTTTKRNAMGHAAATGMGDATNVPHIASECDAMLENQITTTTTTTIHAAAKNMANSNNNKSKHNKSTANTKANQQHNNNNSSSSSSNNAKIRNTNGNHNEQANKQQQQQQQQQQHHAIVTSIHDIDDMAASSCNRANATTTTTTTSSTALDGSANVNANNNSASEDIQQQQQMQQSEHNYSINSSDCDSMSSSEESIDLEIYESNGYQDNTSSHSQHSNGGNSVNGAGAGNQNASANNTLSAAAQAVMGGAAAAGYMSLLPPGSGGSSANSAHLLAGNANAGGSLIGGNGIGGIGLTNAGGLVTTGVGVGTGASSTGSGGTSANPGHSHAHGGSAGSGTGNGETIDFKQLFEELCPVCGDKVSGYHYGLLTCESCKGFFKRTVQNKKVYTCVAERSCHIDKTQRKRCPYCRFQKCLEVGMKLEAVRADRMRGGRNKFGPMYKRDRARKLQMMRQRQLALQALRTTIGSGDMKPTPLSPGYQQAYPNMNIKQEIQIPQVSSLTQSPDSSPSPIAIALGQVNASTCVITPMNGSGGGNGGGGGGSSGGGGGGGNHNNNNSNNSDILNRGNSGNCHDAGSLPNTADSKLCFDSGTHPSSTADSLIEPLRVSPMIRDFVQSIDDREWQTQLFALLQKQTYNQVEVDLFELMCKVLDQNLFSQVDWARNTVFFKDLKVDDQMKLLQHSWSDMLVLDHLHQRIHNGLPDETQLNNGQVFNLLGLGLLGVPQLADYFNDLQNKLQELKFDMGDYVCMKFLILLNPDVRGIINKKTVLEGQENVQAALLDYTLTCYPSVTDKFRRLLNILPDIHAMAARGEEHLYSKHCAGSAPTQTLLMEMLHAKRKV